MQQPPVRDRSSLGSMIEVARIVFGCQWDGDGHVKAWPMRLSFGAVGPEVTVDDMLEGRGHSVLLLDQLVALIEQLADYHTPIQLCPPPPVGLIYKLLQRGYFVELLLE